jgi:hypothetical protein
MVAGITQIPICRFYNHATLLSVKTHERSAVVPTNAAFPGRIPSIAGLSEGALPKVDNVRLPSVSADSAGFAGFKPEDMEAPQGLAKLLRRNEFLNRAEALAALTLLASSGFAEASAFDISERVLYIVSCVSNSLCLRCAQSAACTFPPARLHLVQ